MDPKHLYAVCITHLNLLIIVLQIEANIIYQEEPSSIRNIFCETPYILITVVQSKDSSQILHSPGWLFLLLFSYGTSKAFNITGFLIHSALIKVGFSISKFNLRSYFLQHEPSFIAEHIVVDYITISCNYALIGNNCRRKFWKYAPLICTENWKLSFAHILKYRSEQLLSLR